MALDFEMALALVCLLGFLSINLVLSLKPD
jgi:hypothetical protein